jgi:tetratricopeptide (TPR) repeat protein
MNLKFYRLFLALGTGFFLLANAAFADGTNAASTAITRDEMARNYLQIQEQIHEAQLLLQQNQQAAVAAAEKNAQELTARLQSLELSVAAQHSADVESARKTQQLTLYLAGAFGLAGLGIMLLMVYFQWRAFTQLAQISTQSHPALADVNGTVAQLAAPSRATVESSNARLLDVVDQLEKRIQELEGGQRYLPEMNGTHETNGTKHADPLAEAQKFLDANQPQPALEALEKILSARPNHAEAQVKKAVALEKLGRPDEALACCDRAIAVDGTLAIAHLHKGGLLNRLRRYDEALDCYERALQAQEKKAGPKVAAA